MDKIIQDIEFGFLRAQFSKDNRFQYSGIDSFMYQGDELVHYTNLLGLQGIIESQGFWLSDHRFLNDAEEYNNGKKLVINLIEKLILKKRYIRFKKVLEGTLNYLKQDRESPFYICSFSTKIDSLDQWKGYANNNDGVAIIFNNKMKKMFNHFNVLPIFTASKVIYRDTIKYKILLKSIQMYFKEFLIDEIKNPKIINLEDWSKELFETLSREFINFKNSEFESEGEVRLVVSNTQLSREDTFNLEHRISNNRIIPYINISEFYKEIFQKNKLPIKKIIIAPTANADITYESIKVYLKNIGYDDVTVEKSKVPYRG